jgi:asparagine synthase (glutamine-hydrolysing)
VEFAATVPADFKIHGSRQKVLIKELMKGTLPASILRRKKVGFDFPAHQWLRGPLRPLMMDALSSTDSEYPGLFQRGAVGTCMRQHLERRANLGYHLWGLMMLFLWMRRWRIQTSPVSETPRRKAATSSSI